jgi:hypothetical protein
VGIRRPARREWLEGIARHRQATHMLPIEAPAAFADAVRQAIESSAR